MKIILLALGQLVKSNIAKTFQAFYALTSEAAIDSALPQLKPIIDRFKAGELNEKGFFQQMRQIIDPKNEKNITDEKIISAWNCMSTMDQKTLDDLKTISKLESKHEIQLAVVSRTNPTHVKHIDAQFSEAGIDLKYQRILSFKDKNFIHDNTHCKVGLNIWMGQI